MSKAERTRKFIIETSAPIFNKKGIAGTSLSDIMEATKLAKGGIYGNFENKEEISVESFFYLTRQLSERLDTAVSKENTTREKFFNLLDAYKTKSTIGGCPILNFGVEADDTHSSMKEHVKKAIRSSQKRISDIIEAGINNNELTSEINPHNFSVRIFAMIEGAILCRRVLESDEQMIIVLESIKKEFEVYLI